MEDRGARLSSSILHLVVGQSEEKDILDRINRIDRIKNRNNPFSFLFRMSILLILSTLFFYLSHYLAFLILHSL